MEASAPEARKKRSFDDVLGRLDESFSQTPLRMIDDRDMKDTDVYHRANKGPYPRFLSGVILKP